MKPLTLGLEVECIYNVRKCRDTPRSRRGSGDHFSDYWGRTEDGSLRCKHKFADENTAEFVSVKLKGKEELKKALTELKDEICNGHPLNDVLDFNSSCGAHVHFSTKHPLYKTVRLSSFRLLREKLFKELQERGYTPYQQFVGQYFRYYARKLTKNTYLNNSKYCEFNMTCERENRGMEWRGINLLGCTTWKDFFLFYDTVYDCLQWFVDTQFTYEDKKTIRPTKIEIPERKDLIEKIVTISIDGANKNV